ncbi:MAG: hypothetical protein HOC88_03335, partial [Rhodospirillaceae bacterium]|nr:hypothetical protein [Rhodospirillaceae bacterium]
MINLTLIRIAAGAAVALATLSLALSQVWAEQKIMPASGNICERHIAEAEQSLDIPSQLLLAISVVESGVWDAE